MGTVEVNGISYHMEDRLIKKWDKIKGGKLIKADEDRVYIVDGRERSGKSLFAIQQAAYIDPTFNLDRICFTPDELLNQIKTAPPGSCIIFDEAFRGLSSAQSRSNTNQQIKTVLMEMGQRNLVLFIVLPSYFLLDMYAAILRSHALFHIQKDVRNKKRVFLCFNERKKWRLYNLGIKHGSNYKDPHTKFKGKFYNKYPIDEQAYRKKKADSLRAIYTEDANSGVNKDRENWEFWMAGALIIAEKKKKDMSSVSLHAPVPLKNSSSANIVLKWRQTWEKVLASQPNI